VVELPGRPRSTPPATGGDRPRRCSTPSAREHAASSGRPPPVRRGLPAGLGKAPSRRPQRCLSVWELPSGLALRWRVTLLGSRGDRGWHKRPVLGRGGDRCTRTGRSEAGRSLARASRGHDSRQVPNVRLAPVSPAQRAGRAQPRASACGLSPGLGSPGPLGRILSEGS
jgi:hypothetical protein